MDQNCLKVCVKDAIQTYQFEQIDHGDSLENFFNSIRGKVAAVLNGIKLLIFLFGATCSGKTYTTEGNLKINIFFYCFLPPITKILYLLTDSFWKI